MRPPLSINGLSMPMDFPTDPFEKIHSRLAANVDAQGLVYQEYAAAWNAVSYRFLAATQYSDDFTTSVDIFHGSANINERYRQERALFGFFTNALSTIEAAFYGIFVIGNFLVPTSFPILTPDEQQAVTPKKTWSAYKKTFSGDPLNNMLADVLNDSSYLELRHIRNVLAHRAAPGRQIYLAVGTGEPLPEEWKILNIPLDNKLTTTRRAEVARLLHLLLDGTDEFVQSHFLKGR